MLSSARVHPMPVHSHSRSEVVLPSSRLADPSVPPFVPMYARREEKLGRFVVASSSVSPTKHPASAVAASTKAFTFSAGSASSSSRRTSEPARPSRVQNSLTAVFTQSTDLASESCYLSGGRNVSSLWTTQPKSQPHRRGSEPTSPVGPLVPQFPAQLSTGRLKSHQQAQQHSFFVQNDVQRISSSVDSTVSSGSSLSSSSSSRGLSSSQRRASAPTIQAVSTQVVLLNNSSFTSTTVAATAILAPAAASVAESCGSAPLILRAPTSDSVEPSVVRVTRVPARRRTSSIFTFPPQQAAAAVAPAPVAAPAFDRELTVGEELSRDPEWMIAHATRPRRASRVFTFEYRRRTIS